MFGFGDPDDDAPPPPPPGALMQGDGTGGSDEEADPLDAFMSSINEEVGRQKATEGQEKNKGELAGDEEDPMESFYRDKKRRALLKAAEGNEEAQQRVEDLDEYDSDEERRIAAEFKNIAPLPDVDHASIQYKPFRKAFYREHPRLQQMSQMDANHFRRANSIVVTDFHGEVPKPCQKFAEFNFSIPLLTAIARHGYEKPTPIQAQSIPIIQMGHDVIGQAKTGSGKTAAFVLPMIEHIIDQNALEKGDGPIGLVLAPTRELAQQIYTESKKFAKSHDLRVCLLCGGKSKYDQYRDLLKGCEILVATPGRLIDLVKKKGTNLLRVTYLVLDEADRMLDMGFEPQVRSIAQNIRPDRQTLLYSATFRRNIRELTRDILSAPVRITIGSGKVNEDVTQNVYVLSAEEKSSWLVDHIESFVSQGSLLIFVSTKNGCQLLASNLERAGYDVVAIHGDKEQHERDAAVRDLRKGRANILVATDVAARGLDIPDIKTVVNYDAARSIDAHIHRVGRTGRAGAMDGVSHTLVLPTETKFAADLVRSLEGAGQTVPPELRAVASRNGSQRSWKDNKRGQRGPGSGTAFAIGHLGETAGGSGAPANRAPSHHGGVSGFVQASVGSTASHRGRSGGPMAQGRGAPFVRGGGMSGFVRSSASEFAPSAPQQQQQQGDQHGSAPPKKRSRWDA